MDTPQLVQQFQDLQSKAAGLSPAIYGVPAGALVAGLVLWLSGAKVLKGLFVLAGCAAGAMLGAVQGAAWLPAGVLGVPPAIAGVVIGIVLGLLVSAIVFRFAMAAAGASMAAVASLGCAAMWLSQTPGALPPWPDTARVSVHVPGETEPVVTPTHIVVIDDRAKKETESTPPSEGKHEGITIPPQVVQAALRMQETVNRVSEDGQAWWAVAPGPTRTTMFWSGVFGGLAGLLVGLVSPKKSAAVLTAFAGSAIALLAGAALARDAQWTPSFATNWTTLHWTGVWAVAAAVGAMLQTSRTRAEARPRCTPARA